ncbi:MAG: immune inhibitor A [Actinobacteria bacterium]|nr:immune inhibitor A [Actinomycetota bacterium]
MGTLDATINWDTKHAYSRPGAPPNGSDYVRLRDETGAYLAAGDVTNITFAGGDTLPPFPVEWKVDSSPPQHKSEAFYSGSGPNFDRSIVRRFTVPENKPVLHFDTKWKTEKGWDFGFVQVSTDGGETYKSLSNDDTTSTFDPGTIDLVKDNVPGFTGSSKGWRTERFGLKKYAGEKILLAFRYVTDSGVDLPGWWVDRIRVGNKVKSRGLSLDAWRTATEINPQEVEGFTVQLVSYTTSGPQEAHIAALDLPDGRNGSLDGAAVADAIGNQADVVAAIVTFDESTEQISQYAPYELQVNGVIQPGG